MSDVGDVREVTRVVSLAYKDRRCDALNEGTELGPHLPEDGPVTVRGLFERHQLEMAAWLEQESRLGVMAFALGPERIDGRMWLSATSGHRAGTIGRHGYADLFLNRADDLSLRHSLILVRRLGRGAKIHIVDLSSTNGMYMEDETRVRAVDSDGHVLLGAGRWTLAFFVTGLPVPWQPFAPEPFETLATRLTSSMAEQSRREKRRVSTMKGDAPVESTQVSRAGPVPLGTEHISLPEEIPAGRLTLASSEKRQRLLIGFSALDKGVLLGRYQRCEGAEALDCPKISRVHAVILRRDGRIILADVGSTNGTWMGEDEVRCADITSGASFSLGTSLKATWEPLD